MNKALQQVFIKIPEAFSVAVLKYRLIINKQTQP